MTVCILIGAALGGSASWHIQGERIDSIMAEQARNDAASQAAREQAKKATAIIEEQYEKTLRDAAAVARSNDSIIERLRSQAAASKRRTSCTDHDKAKFERVAEAASGLVGWSSECAGRVIELEAQVTALQDWIRTNL